MKTKLLSAVAVGAILAAPSMAVADAGARGSGARAPVTGAPPPVHAEARAPCGHQQPVTEG